MTVRYGTPVATDPRWVRIAFALVVLLNTVACLHGIANYWQWGHNGFNGAAFTQAARNSLRFGIVAEAQYHTGTTAPAAESLYTHHPLFLHFHLVPLLWLLGDAEWVPRLVPAFYSVAALVMLYAFVKRYYDATIALVSALVFVTIPLNLVFANMIDHEQGAIFYCLLFLYAYARFVEAPSFRFGALSLVAVSCAVQFDWASYYLALFVAIHVFLTGVRRQRRLVELRPEYVFAFALSVVVLANFAAFYAFIVHVRGSFAEMLTSAEGRSASPGGYWAQVGRRALELQTPLYLSLFVVYLARFVTRAVRGESHLGDLLPLFFASTQVVHSTVFKQAGFVHSYWIYYLNPALAVGAGSVMVGAARFVRRGVASLGDAIAEHRSPELRPRIERTSSRLGATIAVAILALPLVVQARDGLRKQRAWFDRGFGNYVQPYDDQFWECEWAKDVSRRFPRDVREALLYRADYRIEWLYYLDAPRTDITSLVTVRSVPRTTPKHHRLVYLDVARSGAVPGLSTLVATQKSYLYDGRFLTIDLDDDDAKLISLEPIEGPRPLWYRWLVHPTRPRVMGWRETSTDPAVILTLSSGAQWVTEQTFGADDGGDGGRFDCPDGFAIDAIQTAAGRWREGPTFTGIRARCRRVVWGTDAAATLHLFGPWLGARGDGEVRTIACSAGSVAIGIHVDTNPYPYALRLACRRLDDPIDPRVPQATTDDGSFTCGADSLVGGLRGRYGLLTDRIGVACVSSDPAFLEVARSLRPRESRALP